MFAGAAREAVFSNAAVIRRINADFVPVALKAGLVNNPPDDEEGRRTTIRLVLADLGKEHSKPEEMIKDLGKRFYVTETAIKTFSVGYPNQSALDALLSLRKEHKLTPDNVQRIVVKLPTDAIGIVAGSAMPDVSCPHLVAVALVKGAVSFVDSHDEALMKDKAILAQRDKVKVVGEPSLMDPAAPRGAIVEVTMTDGAKFDHFTKYPPGTKENPLSTEAVAAKTRDLIMPVLGHEKAEKLITEVGNLEKMKDVRSLRPLWTV